MVADLDQRGFAAALAIREPAIAVDGAQRHADNIADLARRKPLAAQADHRRAAQAVQGHSIELGYVLDCLVKVAPEAFALIDGAIGKCSVPKQALCGS